MIDIIIPAYNAHETIEKTIISICIQNVHNILNVYICNDASDEDYSKIIDKYSKIINIRELKLKKNSGPGVARQHGLDNSNSEYVVFIDADDEFLNFESVELLYKKINDTNSDVVIGDFCEELDDRFRIRDRSFTWLHGKIYRRSFLEKNKIKFNNLSSNEDTYFNKSISIRKPVVEYLDTIVYVYKNNSNSITRRNNKEYKFNGLFDYIISITNVLEEAIDDNIEKEIISDHVTCMFISIYFYYLENIDNKSVNKLIESSRKLKNIYDNYKYNDKDKEFFLYKIQFDIFYNSYELFSIIKPKITFEEFIKLYD